MPWFALQRKRDELETPRRFELRTRTLVQNTLRENPKTQPWVAKNVGLTTALRELDVYCPPKYSYKMREKPVVVYGGEVVMVPSYDQVLHRALSRARRQDATTALYPVAPALPSHLCSGRTSYWQDHEGIACASFVADKHVSWLAGSSCRYPDRCRSSGPGIHALLLGLFEEHPLSSQTRQISCGRLAQIALQNITSQVYESIAGLEQHQNSSEVRGAIKHGMDLNWYEKMCCLISRQLPTDIVSPAAHQHTDRAVASGLVAVALHNQLYVGNMGTCRATLYTYGLCGGVSWKRLSVDHVRGAGQQVAGLASDDNHPLLREAGLGRGFVFAGDMAQEEAHWPRRAEVSVHTLHAVFHHETLVIASHEVGKVLQSMEIATCLAKLGTSAADSERAQAILEAAIAKGNVHNLQVIVWSPPSRLQQANSKLRDWLGTRGTR